MVHHRQQKAANCWLFFWTSFHPTIQDDQEEPVAVKVKNLMSNLRHNSVSNRHFRPKQTPGTWSSANFTPHLYTKRLTGSPVRQRRSVCLQYRSLTPIFKRTASTLTANCYRWKREGDNQKQGCEAVTPLSSRLSRCLSS